MTAATNNHRPLFIPLKTEYFRQFESGSKHVEYRRFGARWNERNCAQGRAVTLSHGYSGARISGVVTSFRREVMTTDTYGPHVELACIGIRVCAPENGKSVSHSA